MNITVTTDALNIAEVESNSLSFSSGVTLQVEGEITDLGGDVVTSKGICWSFSENPTISDSLVVVTNDGDTNLTSHMLFDEYNTTYLNFSGASILPDGTDYELGEVEWNITNLAAGDSFIVYVNFTTIAVGSTTNYAFLENATEDVLLSWDYVFNINGGEPQAFIEMLTPFDSQFFNISNNIIVEYNISGVLTDYNRTEVLIDDGSTWKFTPYDGVGVYNETFVNVSDGSHVIRVELFKHDNGLMAGDNVSIYVNVTGGP